LTTKDTKETKEIKSDMAVVIILRPPWLMTWKVLAVATAPVSIYFDAEQPPFHSTGASKFAVFSFVSFVSFVVKSSAFQCAS
jgi:hypothetical protein